MSAPNPSATPTRPATPEPAAPASPPAPLAPPAVPAPPAAGARLALFRAGGRLCGVAAAFCKQFVHLDAVTPVPRGPASLLGVAQLRGRILPVLDAASLLAPAPLATATLAPAEGPLASGAGGPAQPGMPALVVTATGLDSALAALKVTEIVGFEAPALAAGTDGRAFWRGEEVAVINLGALLAAVRPVARDPRQRPEEARR
jgi:chemotaxis signal transduction protein